MRCICFRQKNQVGFPTASTCSSITKEGIDGVWKTITDYIKLAKGNHYFEDKRKDQNQFWMMETINEQLQSNFYTHPDIIQLLEQNKKAVGDGEISPFAAAQILLKTYFK